MCFGCLYRRGSYTDEAHERRDRKLLEMAAFYSEIGRRTASAREQFGDALPTQAILSFVRREAAKKGFA